MVSKTISVLKSLPCLVQCVSSRIYLNAWYGTLLTVEKKHLSFIAQIKFFPPLISLILVFFASRRWHNIYLLRFGKKNIGENCKGLR
jgi:hypothetical protein